MLFLVSYGGRRRLKSKRKTASVSLTAFPRLLEKSASVGMKK